MQIPFQHKDALIFAKAVQREYRIPKTNILCVGDEVDQYFGSAYLKDPDAMHTPWSELRDAKDEVQRWANAFPAMRIAISNHGLRWAKRAFEAGIPREMIVPYQQLIGAPEGWLWQDRWDIDADYPFCLIHGMGYSGQFGHVKAAQDKRKSVVMGHLHAFGGAAHTDTVGGDPLWGLNCGALCDPEAYAFQYSRDSRNKSTLGLGVVVDGGKTPIFVPFG